MHAYNEGNQLYTVIFEDTGHSEAIIDVVRFGIRHVDDESSFNPNACTTCACHGAGDEDDVMAPRRIYTLWQDH